MVTPPPFLDLSGCFAALDKIDPTVGWSFRGREVFSTRQICRSSQPITRQNQRGRQTTERGHFGIAQQQMREPFPYVTTTIFAAALFFCDVCFLLNCWAMLVAIRSHRKWHQMHSCCKTVQQQTPRDHIYMKYLTSSSFKGSLTTDVTVR